MKQIITLAAIALCSSHLFAQAPGKEARPVGPKSQSITPPGGGGSSGAFHPPGQPGQPGQPPLAGAENIRFKSRLAGGTPSALGGPRPLFDMEGHSSRTLLIGTEKMKPAAADVLREDLNIMSRILDKAVERALDSSPLERRMGITVMSLSGARSENIFLNDYGVIFVLNVPIPLSPSGKSSEGKTEKADSDWEQTKQELYGNNPFAGAFEVTKYDGAKVESLREELIGALKNASNIHELKGDETITVVVTSNEHSDHHMAMSGEGTGVMIKRMVKHLEGGKEEVEEKVETNGKPIPRTGPRSTTLTLRAKKSDIDAFAKGNKSREEFSKLVTVSIY